jgi:hypothetical protein
LHPIPIRRIAQAWLLLLVIGSLQPARPGPVHAMHREIHFLAFGGAAFLLLLVTRNRREEIGVVVGGCLLGLSLEYLQHPYTNWCRLKIYEIAYQGDYHPWRAPEVAS